MLIPAVSFIFLFKASVDSVTLSVSSPNFSNSALFPIRRSAMVFIPLPTCSGSCMISLADAIIAMLSSISFPAVFNADADRCIASPIPPLEIAKRFPISLYLSTILIALLVSTPKAFIVEITLCVASSTEEISSPTVA